MAQAVQECYLANPVSKVLVHQTLLLFFQNAPADVMGTQRKCAEMPYHMLNSGSLEGLQRFCLDLGNFRDLWATRRFDLHVYWR
eukprot:4319395-Prymnesium_polylepis.1